MSESLFGGGFAGAGCDGGVLTKTGGEDFVGGEGDVLEVAAALGMRGRRRGEKLGFGRGGSGRRREGRGDERRGWRWEFRWRKVRGYGEGQYGRREDLREFRIYEHDDVELEGEEEGTSQQRDEKKRKNANQKERATHLFLLPLRIQRIIISTPLHPKHNLQPMRNRHVRLRMLRRERDLARTIRDLQQLIQHPRTRRVQQLRCRVVGVHSRGS